MSHEGYTYETTWNPYQKRGIAELRKDGELVKIRYAKTTEEATALMFWAIVTNEVAPILG